VLKYLFIILLYLVSTADAQSPGGVSTNLELWLKANQGTTVIGSEVSAWADQSGNGNNFSNTAGVARGTLPDLISNNYNWNPSIFFNESVTSDYLATANFSGFSSGGLTQFIVFQHPPSTISNSLLSYASTASNNDFLLFNLNSLSVFRGASINVGNVLDDNIQSIFVVDRTQSNRNVNIYRDGLANAGNSYRSSNGAIRTGGTLMFGQEQDSVGGRFDARQIFKGSIAEVITYSSVIGVNARRQIESYLAIKYGITLNNTGAGVNGDYLDSNGNTIWDADLDDFHNEVFAIARDDNSALNQKQSRSILPSAGVSIYIGTSYDANFPSSNQLNTNSLSNNQYLIIGHNNDNLDIEAPAPSPFGVDNCEGKMNRTFRVIDSGGVSSVTLVFDPSIYNTFRSASLVVSNNQSFNTSVVASSLIRDSSGIFYAEIDFPDSQTSYFKIVSRAEVRPECYSLVSK